MNLKEVPELPETNLKLGFVAKESSMRPAHQTHHKKDGVSERGIWTVTE